jgi:sulfite reductase (ferredoxin)
MRIMTALTAVPETKTQRVERLKREKNPWEALDELRALAPLGFENIPADWLGTYLRWWGVYTQGDGAGVLGGAKGEGIAAPFFMARIRVTNGILSTDQVRTIGRVAAEYARGTADVTVRQNIQLHWIRIENLPDVLDALWNAGLTTMGSCGDDTRNITGCPLAGLDHDEIIDASPLAFAVTQQLVGNAEFYNLPRKFKVAITGCRVWCSYPEINDVALSALEHNGEIGFALRVAGGLSSEPHLAVRVPVFVRWHEVVPVVRAIAETFREAGELREHRDKARMKQLFLRHGWTADRMRAEIEQRLGYRLQTLERDTPPPGVYRDHVGVHPQKQSGYSYVGVNVLRGRLTPEQLATAADLADRYGTGELRTTTMQNFIIPNVRNDEVPEVVAALERAGLPVAASSFSRGAVACTGMEFCKLAITETKSFTRWLVQELEERLPDFAEQLRLNVTGCPNSCGQHWIADIGIEGKKVRAGGVLVDAYYFCIGGGVGANPAIARPVGYRCAASEVPDAIERLLRSYQAMRDEGESLREFFGRNSTDMLRGYLAGTSLVAVERDRPAAAPPHGLEV